MTMQAKLMKRAWTGFLKIDQHRAGNSSLQRLLRTRCISKPSQSQQNEKQESKEGTTSQSLL